ncbi:MAG: DUF2794 domain-containing protein [Notoacmeibacter sp.]
MENGGELIEFSAARTGRDQLPITFHRTELDALLRIYSLMVGAGEWRDYALSHLPDRAVFSVYKRAHEAPLFRVEKVPGTKQGAFAIHGSDGRVLKRGQEIKLVLTVFERLLKLADAKKGRF